MVAVLQENSKGFLKDGREFEIINFQKFAFSDDGTIHSGTVGVAIDGKYGTYTVSSLAENIDYENLDEH